MRKITFKEFAKNNLSEKKINEVSEEIYNSPEKRTQEEWEDFADKNLSTTFRP